MRRQVAWARRVGLERKLAVALLVTAIASGLTTYGVLTGSFGDAQGKGRTAVILLLIDLIVLLLLGIFLARRLVTLWIQRRRGLAGARLHARMVLLFGIAAMTPTIIVAIFTTLFLNLGIDAWFSQRVSTAVDGFDDRRPGLSAGASAATGRFRPRHGRCSCATGWC